MRDDVWANVQLHLLGQRPSRNTAGEWREGKRNSLSRNYFEQKKLQRSVEAEEMQERDVAILGKTEEQRGVATEKAPVGKMKGKGGMLPTGAL